MAARLRIIALNCAPRITTGGHRSYFELVRQLALRGHSIVLIKNRRLSFAAANVQNIDITALSGRPRYSFSLHILLRTLSSIVRIGRACRRSDWIIVHGEVHFPAALLLKLLLRSAILFDPRSNLIGELQAKRMYAPTRGSMALLRLREYWIAHSSNRVILQCRYDAVAFLRRNPCLHAKYRVVANSFRVSWLNWQAGPARTYRPYPHRLLFMATLDARKGIMPLLQALLLLKGRAQSMQLVVAGEGEYAARVAHFVAAQQLAGQVELRGWVDNSARLMQSSDLLVVPSLYDSFPNIILEALCLGLPVLATRVAGIPEILHYDELLCPAGDARALAAQLQAVATERGHYSRLVELCHRRRTHFDFDWGVAVETVLRGH